MDSINNNENDDIDNIKDKFLSEISENESNNFVNDEYLSVFSGNQSDDEKIDETPKENRFLVSGLIYSFLMVFCLSFISFTFIFNYLLMPVQVVGISMRPTLNSSNYNGGDEDETHCDIVYISKENYYKNNEIAVISNEKQQYVGDSNTKLLIKRIIAVPGQTVVFKLTSQKTELGLYGTVTTYTYTVSVLDENGNDINLDQSYLGEEMIFTDGECVYTIFQHIKNEGEFSVTVPEDCYFAMGDNRNNSFDSRYFGVVKYDDILGSVKLVVPYSQTLLSSILLKIKSELFSFASA